MTVCRIAYLKCQGTSSFAKINIPFNYLIISAALLESFAHSRSNGSFNLTRCFTGAADVRRHRINIQSEFQLKTENLALIAVVTAELQTTIKTLLNTHKLRHVVAF